MRILAFDTATSACSAALWEDGRVGARRFETMTRGHAEALVPMIADVMDEAGTNFPRLDLIAVTVGPGAFTGLRIGLAAARGMALAAAVPCLGGLTDDEALDISATLLRRVAPYAEEKGVNLNMELLNSKVDHAGYQGDHTAWGVALCEAVGSPRVKLLYDIYHMQIMEGDVIRTIRDSINWIGHFHTAGNPGRNDMDDTQELCYPAICKAIAETDYDLYLGHEFTAKGDRLEALAAAYDTCSVD